MTAPPKTILHLSAVDYGGAGKFALDLHRLLAQQGHRSYFVVKDAKSGQPDVIPYPDARLEQPLAKLARNLQKRVWTPELFHYDYYFYNRYERYSVVSARKILGLIPAHPDAIFIHWTTDFINTRLIRELQELTGARIYWLVIDNAPLTGGCHYPWDCQGYQRDCRPCPAIRSERYQHIAADNLAFKKKYLPADTQLVTFSQQDYERAGRSALFGGLPIRKLLGLVDETVFMPGDKLSARAHFDLPADQPVIFFGASALQERRKGMSLLLEALEQLGRPDVFLLVAGQQTPLLEKLPVRHAGYLSEPELVLAYQAADVFACPSLEDSGPMMINQAMMCGTPVVAFDTGVARDLVVTGQTGYRATPSDATDFARGLRQLLELNEAQRGALTVRCRELATRLCSRPALTTALQQLLS